MQLVQQSLRDVSVGRPHSFGGLTVFPLTNPNAPFEPDYLTLAEALVVRKGATAKDKEQAKEILKALKDRPGVAAEELGRIAALIDPRLPEELDLPAPEAADGEAPKRPKRRRGR